MEFITILCDDKLSYKQIMVNPLSFCSSDYLVIGVMLGNFPAIGC